MGDGGQGTRPRTRHLARMSTQAAGSDSIVGKRAAVRVPVALVLAQLFNVLLAHL